jgi:hypothetical protein
MYPGITIDGSAEDRDAVAHRHRLNLVVGHVDGRDAEPALDQRDLRAYLQAQLRIELRERLVHQEHARLAQDRPPHRDALALAAGELGRLAVDPLGEPEHRGRVVDLARDLGLRHAAQLQREADLLADRHVRVQRMVLEDHRDVAVLGGDVVDDALADAHGAGADLLEARNHSQHGDPAAAGRADEDHKLAFRDRQVKRIIGQSRRAHQTLLRRRCRHGLGGAAAALRAGQPSSACIIGVG